MLIAITFCLVVAVGALSLDWLQTLTIARNPAQWSEINVILGKHPSVSRVCWYFGAWVVVMPVATAVLCLFRLPGLALGLCVLIAVFEGAVVWRNYRLGIVA